MTGYIVGFVTGVLACIIWPTLPTTVKAKALELKEKLLGASSADDKK